MSIKQAACPQRWIYVGSIYHTKSTRCRRVPPVLKQPIPPIAIQLPSKRVQVYGVTTLNEANAGSSNFNRPTVLYRITFRFLLSIAPEDPPTESIAGLAGLIVPYTSRQSINKYTESACHLLPSDSSARCHRNRRKTHHSKKK
jgi:hypothetical protein